MDERTAWELLSLVEQIHLWAITEFRAFILEHLRAWHQFCEENYLLDWDSVYDNGRQLKRKRTCSEVEDFPLPAWVDLVSEPIRQRAQARAKNSLRKAMEPHRLRKGKAKCTEESESESGWHCMLDECPRSQETTYGSNEAYLDHIRACYSFRESTLAQLKRYLDQAEKESLSGNVSASSVETKLGPPKRVRVI